MDVGVWLSGRWILIAWTLDFDCFDVGFRLVGLGIFVG